LYLITDKFSQQENKDITSTKNQLKMLKIDVYASVYHRPYDRC